MSTHSRTLAGKFQKWRSLLGYSPWECKERTQLSNFTHMWGFPGGSVLKNLSALKEIQVRCLGQEDPLEKEMAAHSNILAWELPRTEEPAGLQSMRSQRVGQDLVTQQHCHVRQCCPPPQLVPPSPSTCDHMSTLHICVYSCLWMGLEFVIQ